MTKNCFFLIPLLLIVGLVSSCVKYSKDDSGYPHQVVLTEYGDSVTLPGNYHCNTFVILDAKGREVAGSVQHDDPYGFLKGEDALDPKLTTSEYEWLKIRTRYPDQTITFCATECEASENDYLILEMYFYNKHDRYDRVTVYRPR